MAKTNTLMVNKIMFQKSQQCNQNKFTKKNINKNKCSQVLIQVDGIYQIDRLHIFDMLRTLDVGF